MNKNVLKSAMILALFTLFGTSSLIWVHAKTKDRIADNERALLLARLNEILPASEYDNDLAVDIGVIISADAPTSKEALTVYRARKNDKPVAAILTTIASDGYNGAIRLLVGVFMNGKLAGVRVIRHRETPGLGDKVETSRSNWVLGFNGKSLNNPKSKQWAVKPDGGTFDSFTGATITPRAVVKAVHKTLIYFDQNQSLLFEQSTDIQ